MSDTMERHIARREAHELAAQLDYFSARPHLVEERTQTTFRAGFTRGFDAARYEYATPPAEAVTDAMVDAARDVLHEDYDPPAHHTDDEIRRAVAAALAAKEGR